jgi:hypothetical protein
MVLTPLVDANTNALLAVAVVIVEDKTKLPNRVTPTMPNEPLKPVKSKSLRVEPFDVLTASVPAVIFKFRAFASVTFSVVNVLVPVAPE